MDASDSSERGSADREYTERELDERLRRASEATEEELESRREKDAEERYQRAKEGARRELEARANEREDAEDSHEHPEDEGSSSDEELKKALEDAEDAKEDLHEKYVEDFESELEKHDEQHTQNEDDEADTSPKGETPDENNDHDDYDQEAARRERQKDTLPHEQYHDDEEKILEAFEEHGHDKEEVKEHLDERYIDDVEEELEGKAQESTPETSDNDNKEGVEGPEGESKTEGTVTWVESGDGTVSGVVTDTSESQGSSSETSQEHEENAESSESTDDTASTSEMETSGSSEHGEPAGSECRTRETEADAGMEKSRERGDLQEGIDGHEDARSESESTEESKKSLDETRSTSVTKETSEQQEDVASEHSESPSATKSESHLEEAGDDPQAGIGETPESGQTKRVERPSVEPGHETDSHENGHDTGTPDDEHVKEIERESAETAGAESEAHSYSERSAEQEARERSSVEQSLVEDEETTKESASDEAIEKIKEILEEAEIEEDRELLPNEDVIGKEYKWWETEEDRLLEKLFEGLDEKTKRRLKKLLDVKIEDEEGLDGLLDVFKNELHEKQNLSEAVERAREYLRFKKKQRELGISEDLDEVDLEEVAERTGVDTHDASFWVSDRERPALVQLIEELERERRIALIWAYKNALRKFRSLTRDSEHPVTYEQLERYLEKLPKKSQTEVSKESIKEAADWISVMESLGSGEVRTVTKKGEKFVHEEDVEKLARLLSLPKEKVARWLKGEETPDLISDISKSDEPSPTKWSMGEVDRLLQVHDDLMKHPKFTERYRKLKTWFEMMDGLEKGEYTEKPTPTQLKHLAEKHGVTIPTVRKWLTREQIPMLLLLLKRRCGEFDVELRAARMKTAVEKARLRVAAESHVECKIEASNAMDPLVDEPDLTASKFAEVLSRILKGSNKKLIFIDVGGLSEFISRNMKQIETELRFHLRDSHYSALRPTLALVEPNLYVRAWDDNPLSYINLFENELFYFEKDRKRALLSEVMAAAGARNREQFSNLIRVLCPGFSDRGYGVSSDLQSKSAHFKGMVLHLVMDILGLRLDDLEGQVVGIGASSRGRRQIKNPRFLEGENLLEVLARLFAIVASDGSISASTLRLKYTEKNAHRRLRVRQLVNNLGVVFAKTRFPKGRTPEIAFPSVLGRLMMKLGLPAGDKVLQGVRLPDFILNGLPRIQLAYLEELIPEEGSIQVRADGRATIQWGRTVVLFDDWKTRLYGRIAKIGQDHTDLVITHGKFEEKRQCFRLTMGKLRNLMDDPNPEKSRLAKELMAVVRSCHSKLLEDERELCSMNQIKTNVHVSYVRFYLRSERVSLHWEAQTSTPNDVIRWFQLAPPNDIRKRKKMQEWVSWRVETRPTVDYHEEVESDGTATAL